MIFNDIQAVFEAIKKVKAGPKQWIINARTQHEELKALVYGKDFVKLLLKIEHIESDKKALARKKYARPIKDINSKILAPVDNVFSANGGSKVYNIANTNEKSDFIKHISNVRDGKSIEQWLQTYWAKDLYAVDPSGLMFLEWKDKATWLTYKSIDSIRDYKASGMVPEYIIFEPKQEKIAAGIVNMWRIIDDANEYTIIQQGDLFSVDEDRTFVNPFKKVQARIISDKKYLGSDGRISIIDKIIETEKEYLRDRSILTIYKFLNGFATPYRPVILCPECHGTAKTGIQNCTACKGTGKILEKDITDEILLPIDLTNPNASPLPTNFAGYISPDLEIWDQYRKELKELFKEMFEAMWGTRESDEVKDQTAMGVILNTQPMITQLNYFSDVAEAHESGITELLGNFYLPTKNEDRIAIITYGRNYIVQPPEYLLSEYQKSNTSNDPITIRDRKLSEYLTSKYKNDPETLRVELLKKELEPYIHFDIKTVKEIYGANEAMKKGWFTDFWESLKDEQKYFTVEKLEVLMDEYFKVKLSKIEPTQETAIINN